MAKDLVNQRIVHVSLKGHGTNIEGGSMLLEPGAPERWSKKVPRCGLPLRDDPRKLTQTTSSRLIGSPTTPNTQNKQRMDIKMITMVMITLTNTTTCRL